MYPRRDARSSRRSAPPGRPVASPRGRASRDSPQLPTAPRSGQAPGPPRPRTAEGRCPGPGETGVKFGRGVWLCPVLSARKGPPKLPLSSLLPAESGGGRAGGSPGRCPPTGAGSRRRSVRSRCPGRGERVPRPPRIPAWGTGRPEGIFRCRKTNDQTTKNKTPQPTKQKTTPNQTANEASSLKRHAALRGSPPGPAPRRRAARGSGGPGAPSRRPEGPGPAHAASPRLGAAVPPGNRAGREVSPAPAVGFRWVRAVGFRSAPQP